MEQNSNALMKKKFYLLSALFITCSIAFAQQVIPKTWKYGKQINNNDPYFGARITSNGEALVAGGGNATNYNFTIARHDTSGTLKWKKVYVSRNQGEGYTALDANEDLLVVSSFASDFELNTDTLTTSSVTDKQMFIGKFSGQTGDNLWIKSYGQEKPKAVQFLANGNILLQIAAAAGPFTFDGNVIITLASAGDMFLELSNTNGSVSRHFFFPQFILPVGTMFHLQGDIFTYIDAEGGGAGSPNRYMVKTKYDLNSSTITQRDSLLYKSQYYNLFKDFSVTAAAFDPTTGHFYFAGGESRDYMILGTDTIAKNSYALMHYDDNLNLVKRLDANYAINKIYIEDTTVVTSSIVENLPNAAYLGADTILPPNYEDAHMIMRGNASLNNRSYAFMATDNWDTGLELRDIDVDNAGNVYVLGFHGEDILFPPHNVPEANRSWKHLSALGKLQYSDGATVGLKEELNSQLLSLFPNPSAGIYTIQLDGAFELDGTNLDGKAILRSTAKDQIQIDLSSYPQGTYVLKVRSGNKIFTERLLKL